MCYKELLVLFALWVVMPPLMVLTVYLLSNLYDYFDDKKEAKKKAKEAKKAKLG